MPAPKLPPIRTVILGTLAVATAVTMMPNGDKDNKDDSSNNNDKATTTLTATTKGVSVVNHAETIAALMAALL